MERRLSDRLLLGLVPPLAAGIIRLLGRSMRLEIQGKEALRQLWGRGERAVFVCWHDQLLMMHHAYEGSGIALLISASKDGELIARTLERLGHRTVRGSSSRGGREAFRGLLQAAGEGLDLALTPDGPRGPRHQVKPGTVRLARLTGRPVVPVAFACSRGHRFASWDCFLLPYPLSRGVFRCGLPLEFSREEGDDAACERLQQALEENEREARKTLEVHGVSAV